MIEISKQELISLLSAHYHTQLTESTYKIYNFSEKYGCSFDDFEKRIRSAKRENFDEWDDYIAWKGHLQSAKSLSEIIKKIEDGLFSLT